ncbi:MAG: carbohydrate ABC transporter permease [Actinobacteria bacterium]|nr:carbohydrate ABC transporter permease [Actinomycetota bacterium]
MNADIARARRRARRLIERGILSVMLVLGGLLMLWPVIWVLSNSIASTSERFSLPPVYFPSEPTFEAYVYLFTELPFARQLLNTVIVTVCVVLGSTVVAILGAYAFARLRFPGRDALFAIILVGLMIPVQVSSVPQFLLVRGLGLYDSLPAVIVPALIQVLALFILRQHFMTIPKDIEEAAAIDGANRFHILWRIIVPMSWPAIFAVAITTTQYIWNDFFWPNLFLETPGRMTAALGLVSLQNTYASAPVAPVFAGLSVLSVPVVIFFALFQRQLRAGISYAGIVR